MRLKYLASFLVVVMCFSQVALAGQGTWLVKSNGKFGQILWQNGNVTKGDPKADFHKADNKCHSASHVCEEPLDVSLWQVGAQGGAHETWTVTYMSPELWTADQVIVTYDLTTATVLSAERQTSDGTTQLSTELLTLASYCTGTYGCI